MGTGLWSKMGNIQGFSVKGRWKYRVHQFTFYNTDT